MNNTEIILFNATRARQSDSQNTNITKMSLHGKNMLTHPTKAIADYSKMFKVWLAKISWLIKSI